MSRTRALRRDNAASGEVPAQDRVRAKVMETAGKAGDDNSLIVEVTAEQIGHPPNILSECHRNPRAGERHAIPASPVP